jgi:hypothetical protein
MPAALRLSEDEVAALDAATSLPPVYPYWFNAKLVDQPTQEALAGGRG